MGIHPKNICRKLSSNSEKPYLKIALSDFSRINSLVTKTDKTEEWRSAVNNTTKYIPTVIFERRKDDSSYLLNLVFGLKGVLDDYTWGYHRKPEDYPLSWVPISFSSVDSIISNP